MLGINQVCAILCGYRISLDRDLKWSIVLFLRNCFIFTVHTMWYDYSILCPWYDMLSNITVVNDKVFAFALVTQTTIMVLIGGFWCLSLAGKEIGYIIKRNMSNKILQRIYCTKQNVYRVACEVTLFLTSTSTSAVLLSVCQSILNNTTSYEDWRYLPEIELNNVQDLEIDCH